ncbi:MAG: DUF1569 domain-containing protein [Ferruginibacter sp.]
MKSIFDPGTENELIARIHALTPESKALWGKMNVFQMVKHCTLCEDMYLGNMPVKRAFIGRLLGRFVLKQVLKDEKPFSRNSPTSPLLNTSGESGDFAAQKEEWISRIKQYRQFNRQDFVHPFFGPLTKEQVGLLDYKHIDHHLRQFGA